MKTAREVLEKAISSFQCHRSAEVVSCSTCEGVGYRFEEKPTSYHRGEYATETKECLACKAQGRVVVVRYKILVPSSGWHEIRDAEVRLMGSRENVDDCLKGKFRDSCLVHGVKGVWG